MKKTNLILSIFLLMSIPLMNCDNGDDPKSIKEERTEYLVNKTGDWSLKSISVPANSATVESDWTNFNVSATASTITTSGHATGAEAVWPGGGWTMNEEGTSITRSDGVVMTILALTETSFNVTFTVPEGTEINNRIAALDGDYRFDLQ
jgi:hypothetical protein